MELKPEKVFKYFYELSAVPRGSGNMKGIANYCMAFANAHSLDAMRDDADNVIIFKPATPGYETAEPVILQGHLDMVCQKTPECEIDFEKDGLDLYVEGDFLKARGTTLGADNGIAIAMILAILDSDDIEHPAIEAVFTTDEEIGLLGAAALDTSRIKGKKLINLDSEEFSVLTVSCAGGADVSITLPVLRKKVTAPEFKITLAGLKGGHSGVEINKNRVNAATLAGRVLNSIKNRVGFEIIAIDGGDKSNAIPNRCVISLSVADAKAFKAAASEVLETVKEEISDREEGFGYCIEELGVSEHSVIDKTDALVSALCCALSGVVEMSADIEGLVQSSQNLGILKTEKDEVIIHFSVRSNKKSAMKFLEERLCCFAKYLDGATVTAFGHYPPWEFLQNSQMQALYIERFEKMNGYKPSVEAIHAGLECGVLSNKISGLDCISIGPELYDVHTVNERLSISSTQKLFALLIDLLKECK